MKSLSIVLLMLCALTISAIARAEDANGTWRITIESGAGKSTSTLVLKNDRTSITGSYKGQFANAPLTGTLIGDDLMIVFNTESQGVPLLITYVGKLHGGTMQGTVSVTGYGEGTFTGFRE